jgi:hypothetical protein
MTEIEQATDSAPFIDDIIDTDIEYGAEDSEETAKELDFN